jgi:3-dehydroquinate synthase
MLHGEAVALGMALAFHFSAETGLCPSGDADRVISHLAGIGLATSLAETGLRDRGADLVDWMARDKKNAGSRIALVLARGIGRAFFEPNMDRRRLADFLGRAA